MNKIKSSDTNRYWNSYYNKQNKQKVSNFAVFVFKKFIEKKMKEKPYLRLLDIGCGDGRDSFYFSKKKIKTVGIDASKNAIKNNTKKIKKKNQVSFLVKDINKHSLRKKFNLIYIRFFLHAINSKSEKKLLQLIDRISKKKTLIFFEYRSKADPIFKKGKKLNSSDHFYGHYRRMIDPKDFRNKLIKKLKYKSVFYKVSNKFAVKGNDHPMICRNIFEKLK
tara:strand:- start:1880 stop:2542 length:663 start_codon:yes stop_codon:yes gene_type:complete